jgi:hypothetical protein
MAGFAREITELGRDRAFETITRRGDEHVLFIVDNIHLDEKYARDVFNHWQEISNESQLLLLGRSVARGPDARGCARPFDDLESETRILQAGPADLAGVFQRLTRRLYTSNERIPDLPDEVVQHWSTLFGGDLIAFCAAVARRASRLIEGDWQLNAEDAAAYVRETYLYPEPVSEAERRNLLYASVLATLEYDLAKSALERAAFDHALKTGLIHRLERGREKHVYFHLVHPGIGRLLLAATETPLDELTVLTEVAHRHPYSASAIIARLDASGRQPDAATVLNSILAIPQGLSDITVGLGLQYTRGNISRLGRLRRRRSITGWPLRITN